LLASAGAVALAASLSSCGFNYATDRVYDVAAGTTNRDAPVDVLSAVIVSAQTGSGTLITSFSNNNFSKAATVTGITAGSGSDVQVENFQPIRIAAGGLVNLADRSPVVVKAPTLQAGDFETLKFSFDDGSSENVDIPVVWACNEWQGMDSSGSLASSSPSSSTSPSGKGTGTAAPHGSSSASPSESPSGSASSAASGSSESASPSESGSVPAAPSSSGTSTQCAVPSSSAFPESSESSGAPE
jgi:hypothetical protein